MIGAAASFAVAACTWMLWEGYCAKFGYWKEMEPTPAMIKDLAYAVFALFIILPYALMRHGGDIGTVFGTLYFATPFLALGAWICTG